MKRFGISPPLSPLEDWVTFGAPEGSSPTDWIYLGKLAEFGRAWKVRFAVADEKVIAVFGKRGQGKSFTLGVLLEALALEGGASDIASIQHDRAVLLIDPLNIFQWIDVPLTDQAAQHSDELAAQVSRAREWGLSATPIKAQIFFPAGAGETVFRREAVEFRLGVNDFTLDEWATLFDLDIVRDLRGHLVAELYEKVTRSGWTGHQGRVEAPDVPEIGDYVECISEDTDINSGIYRDETIRAVKQRLRAISAYPVFQGVGTSVGDLLKPRVITVVLVNGLAEDLRHVVVSVLARRIVGARAAASAAQKDLLLTATLTPQQRADRESVVRGAPPKTWIVVDEAQDIVPAGRKTAATDAIIKVVKEGRNFGLSFVLTTQQPNAVDSRVLSQVETFLVHKLVSRSDIDLVIENSKCPLPAEIRDAEATISVHDLVSSLDVGQVFLSDTYAPRCAVVSIRARVAAHGGFEA